MERGTRIELVYSAWKADSQPIRQPLENCLDASSEDDSEISPSKGDVLPITPQGN